MTGIEGLHAAMTHAGPVPRQAGLGCRRPAPCGGFECASHRLRLRLRQGTPIPPSRSHF
jgi:hypothetical protein